MAARVLVVNGSPRKGNTDAMARAFVEGAREAGARVRAVKLARLAFSGCCGWSACFYEHYCIVHDAFFGLHKTMLAAHAFCFAVPNYFNSVPGLFKDFIDRTNPYTRPPLYEGTPTALLCVGGYSMDSVKKEEAYLREVCRIHRLPVKGVVRAVADEAGEVLAQPRVLARCRALGARMARQAAARAAKQGRKKARGARAPRRRQPKP